MPFFRALLLLLLAAACSPDGPPAEESPRPPAPPVAAEGAARGWRSVPTEGVRLREGDPLVVETGPHAVLWPAGQGEVLPPYTVSATLRKPQGRLHEGYGIVVGGSGLEGPEEAQRYSYFLVRGDGSFLIKRRMGAELPVVRHWTFHPAIRRDTDEGGQENRLEVRVGEEEVVFVVNGAEVARVPAGEVDTRGVPGLRVAHDVRLAVDDFRVAPGPQGSGR